MPAKEEKGWRLMSYDVEKPDEQWRAELSPSEYTVLRQAATEPAFTGEYTDTKTEGVYACRACGAELFTSKTKFESALRLALVLRPAGLRSGRTDRGPVARHGAHRGALLPLRGARTSGTSSRARGTRRPRTSGTASTASR
ncbi:Peptide methionine sulfoxide reductase MsrB [Streptomyces hirsutus]